MNQSFRKPTIYLSILFSSLVLQGCDEPHVFDPTKASPEMWAGAEAEANRYNQKIAQEFLKLRGESLDGQGRIFFKFGVGIVYEEGHRINPSKALRQYVCTSTHWWTDRCTSEAEMPMAYPANISNTGRISFVLAKQGIVCTSSFEDAQKNPFSKNCKPITASAFPDPKIYALLKPHIDRNDYFINGETRYWVQNMPKASL